MATTSNSSEADRNERSVAEPKQVKVWDIAVRVFHWSLVTSFAIAWLSADEWDRIHEIAGYIIAVLVGFRLIWGFVGSKHARFADFVCNPVSVLDYLKDTIHHKAKRYIGHNPVGGAMTIALLLSLVTITASGIAMSSNMFWGVEWVEEVHEISANLTVVLVGLHIAGVIFSSFSHSENLAKSMITGYKRGLSDQDK